MVLAYRVYTVYNIRSVTARCSSLNGVETLHGVGTVNSLILAYRNKNKNNYLLFIIFLIFNLNIIIFLRKIRNRKLEGNKNASEI